MEKLKVMIHVNEMERWPVALGNVENLFASAGEDNVDVIVLGNGNSVGIYDDLQGIEEMRKLSKRGARFRACRNSLARLKPEGGNPPGESELPDFVEVVPAGIMEVISRQREGYAYVKP